MCTSEKPLKVKTKHMATLGINIVNDCYGIFCSVAVAINSILREVAQSAGKMLNGW